MTTARAAESEWAGIRWRSNRGQGPLVAWCEGTRGRFLLMCRRHIRGSRVIHFEIPKAFLKSPACGWVAEAAR